MYQTPTSLIPPLPPQAYYDPEFAERERRAAFMQAWHLVAVQSDLARDGQFVALELFGIPLLVRNFNGELVALRNVCAHRQSILARQPKGCSPTLKCPYHGWEYGADGRTRKLPGASNFPKFQHQQYCLEKFAVETCGQLVFVRFSPAGPTLREWMGERFDTFAQWFSSEKFECSMSCRFEIDANWKIPVEGSLESYHIPCVHPKTFHEDPGEKPSTHFFYPEGTSFQTVFLAPRWIDRRLRDTERFVLARLGVPYTGDYDHHHVFPHLLISRTDSLSVAQVVYPIDANHSFTMAMQVGVKPARPNPVTTLLARAWGKFTAWLTRTILAEDRDIFPAVQAGVRGAHQSGILGRCEERLHALQQYIHDRIQQSEADAGISDTIPNTAELPAATLPSSEVCHD
jgi:phenylpropionate dioxygenase-like ring-hydroxylating dioxygenase large terminal subunit